MENSSFGVRHYSTIRWTGLCALPWLKGRRWENILDWPVSDPHEHVVESLQG